MSVASVASVYATCNVSDRPQLTTPSPAAGTFVSVTTTPPLRNMPLDAVLSVSVSVSVSSTSAVTSPSTFPTYAVTVTVSDAPGSRFSSVSDTSTYITYRTTSVSTAFVYPEFA